MFLPRERRGQKGAHDRKPGRGTSGVLVMYSVMWEAQVFYDDLLTVHLCFMHFSECYISQLKCISVVMVVMASIFNKRNWELPSP